MRTHKAALLIAFVTFCMVSCKENDTDTQTLAEITIIAETSYTASAGTTFVLSVTAFDTNGQRIINPEVSWESNAPEVAAISNGIISVQSNGSVTISATSGEIRDEKVIEITIIEDLILFELNDLSDQRQAAGSNTFTFLDEATMSASLVGLSEGPASLNISRAKDQVFYLAEGSIEASIDGQTIQVGTEGVLFLTAGTTAIIDDVIGPLKMIKVVLNKDFNQNATPFKVFTADQIETTRNPNQNIWNPFLNERSIITGLYMLPQTRGGDGRLEHPFDEINIIVNGSSSFRTDKGTVSVKKGSVVFVRQGNGHLFQALNEDIDILILWNK